LSKPETDQSGDRISAASDQIKATAKWIIAALAGVGAALIAGLQLTGLGKLGFGELLIAVGGLALALGAVLVAIWVVSKVLTPPMVLLDELPEYVGELTDKDVTLLMGQAADLETLLDRYKLVDRESRERWEEVEGKKETAKDEAAKNALQADIESAESKDEQFESLNGAVDYLRGLALNMKVRKAFEEMRRPLTYAVIAAVIGVVVLAYETNRPEDKPKTPPHTTKAVGQSPVGVKLVLTSDERKVLAPRLGKKCRPGPLWGMAIGGRPVALDAVTLPTPRCRSIRVMVTPGTGIVIHRSPLRRVVRAEELARESG
jgi:hypothetical protein